MIELNDTHVLFAFSAQAAPALTVESGSTVRIRTKDCFSNQLKTESDTLDKLDWSRVNPATGPIFVEGAEPGDVLEVHIESIELDNQAAIATGTDEGVLGDVLSNGLVSVIKPVQNGHLVWNNQLALPLTPMIGVIGVAPEGAPVDCGTPDHHGGNMDTLLVTAGATLYFPVAAPGALFGLGDMHAVMGNGEIGVSGAEIAGYTTVTLAVRKDLSLRDPFLVNSDVMAALSSADTLDEAAHNAVHTFHELLLEKTEGYSAEELAMIMSLAGNVEVSQMVDPQKTARFCMPQSVLRSLGFSL